MKKPTYEQQNEFLSKYIAPIFLDLDFRPAFGWVAELPISLYKLSKIRCGPQDYLQQMAEYSSQINNGKDKGSLEDFAMEMLHKKMDLKKKPLEVLETEALKATTRWAESLQGKDEEAIWRKEVMVKGLLEDYAKRLEPDNMDPALRVIMNTLGVSETGEGVIYKIEGPGFNRQSIFPDKEIDTDYQR